MAGDEATTPEMLLSHSTSLACHVKLHNLHGYQYEGSGLQGCNSHSDHGLYLFFCGFPRRARVLFPTSNKLNQTLYLPDQSLHCDIDMADVCSRTAISRVVQ